MQEASVDSLVAIFSNTFGSLRGSWGTVFATVVACKYNFNNLKVHISLVWALLVTLVLGLVYTNRKFTSRGPARLDPGKLVVITGAASGLGFYLAAVISRTNPVIAIDKNKMKMNLENVEFLQLDCTDQSAITRALTARPVFALVNCVGVAKGGSTMEIPDKDISLTFTTNFMAPVWATRAVLPQMSTGYIVNISSSTSYVGPRKAGIYAASKAALRVWHESLRQELKGTSIKAILVVPGQLDTPMFDRVRTPDRFLAPVVRATDLGDQIVHWLRSGYAGEIFTPVYAQVLPIVTALLPQSVMDLLRAWNGLDNAMDTF